jgi:hypothetical protein
MEWLVNITGDISDLEDLSKSLRSSALSIIKEGQDFVLKSTGFNSLKDVQDVKNKASEILALVNGAARLDLGMRKPLSMAHVVKDDGTREVFVEISDTLTLHDRVTASVVASDGTVQEVHQVSPIPSWVATAQRDANVAKVLRLFGIGHYDWVNLYRIYEVVENDIGGISNIVKKGWATRKTIERFKHTANSPGAIGDESRHGKQTSQPPKDPMTLSEAKSLVETILHNWLRMKGE